MTLKTNLTRLFKDNRGATAIEYGLIVSLIVIAMIGGMGSFADNAILMWDNISTSMASTT